VWHLFSKALAAYLQSDGLLLCRELQVKPQALLLAA
jgi:hypothetical protein